MKSISSCSWNDIQVLLDVAKEKMDSRSSLQEAAQTCVRLLYETFEASFVLTRLYAMVRYEVLPPQDRAFADELARSKGVDALLKGSTPCLSLLGTYGVERAWTDRRTSQGHLAIPLVSSDFVESSPMVFRLFNGLGIKLEWIDDHDGIVEHMRRGLDGMYYIEDATTTVDHFGRKIIPAQEFVAQHGIRTVFGFGGTYIDGTLVALVLFTREAIPPEKAEMFASLMHVVKASTMNLVWNKHIYADGAADAQ